MNKTEFERMTNRVEGIVRCTCGQIASDFNGRKTYVEYTDEQRMELILNGTASIKNRQELLETDSSYRSKSLYLTLIACYDFVDNAKILQAKADDKALDAQSEVAQNEVVLASKRLLDRISLNIIAKEDIPKALEDLSQMSQTL